MKSCYFTLVIQLICLLQLFNCGVSRGIGVGGGRGSGILSRLKISDDLMSQLPQHPNPNKKCYTKTCYSEAFSIYKRLGAYFKPCDNFFLYTCGGFFMKENGLSDMENMQEKISNLIYEELLSKEISPNDTDAIKNAKFLFESCKQKEDQFYYNFKTILINEFDGWPLLGDNYYKVNITKIAQYRSKNKAYNGNKTEIENNNEDLIDNDNDVDDDDDEDDDVSDNDDSNVIHIDIDTSNDDDINSTISTFNSTKNIEINQNEITNKTNATYDSYNEAAEKSFIDSGFYEKLRKLFKFGINPFFRIDVDVNPFNNTKFAIWIRRPISIRFKSHQLIDVNLKLFLKKMVVFLNSSCSIESIDEQVNGTIRLENTFNLINKKNKSSPPIITMTIHDLIRELPDFDWKLYIVDKVFNETLNLSINLNQSIVIMDIENLKRSIELFKNETKESKRRDLENFFIWELIKSMMQYFPNTESTNKTANGGDNKTALQCARYVTSNLNFLVSKYFIEKHADAETLKGAIQMTESIRSEFISMIKENDWMDENSKMKAITKLNNMVFKIAYPDYILNDTLMNELYNSFKFEKNDFLHNDLLIKRIINLISFEYLNQEVHRQSWKLGPAVANAAYFTLMNEIYIPVGIIQPPFFNKETLMLFNYARLGSIIGHEIAHGFDNEGRKFDQFGNFHSDDTGLWNSDSVNKYNNKSECFIRHYSNYTIANLAQKLNGIQTLEENISDNLGFRASYRAYKKYISIHGEEKLLPDLFLTHDQLYFIAYAQTLCEFDTFKFVLEQNHSPNEIRLYGVVSNMKEFSSAFNCSIGDFHSPHEQCSIW